MDTKTYQILTTQSEVESLTDYDFIVSAIKSGDRVIKVKILEEMSSFYESALRRSPLVESFSEVAK